MLIPQGDSILTSGIRLQTSSDGTQISRHMRLASSRCSFESSHIIDLEAIVVDGIVIDDIDDIDDKIRVADLVVTVCLNHDPKTLERFMDISHDLKYHYRYKTQGAVLDFCIVRQESVVTVNLSSTPLYANRVTLIVSVVRISRGVSNWGMG